MQKTPKHIDALFASKIASSGLSKAVAKKLAFAITSPDAMGALHLPKAWSFALPYFDLDGKRDGFARYRYLEDIRSGFDKVAGKRQMRYAQVPGTVNQLYLPPLLDWRKFAADTDASLIITEGELKAACATLHGVPTIGLGGVWCFRAASKGLAAIPSFDWLQWEGRKVVVLFDSDAATNSDIVRAESALCQLLHARGALPSIARLPALTPTAKTGLDDFLIARGRSELIPILDNAEPYTAALALHELNNEVVYVRNPGLIMRLDNQQRMSPKAFAEHAYSTRVFTQQVEDGKGGFKLVSKSAPKAWMSWPKRAEVSKVVYAPGQPRDYDGVINVWPGYACTPQEGDITPWNELLDHLFNGDEESRRWFEQWLAYPLQHPGTKLATTCVLWGVHTGTGKSLVAYTMRRIYGSNFTEIEEENLSASHNEWAENKQFVLGDDVTGKEHRAYADKLKGMITRQILRINPKYIPAYEMPDLINYMFTSNQPDAFFLEDEDRRFFIHEVNRRPMPDKFYQMYDAWYKSEAGPRALFHHLLALDTKDFNPNASARMTASKAAMIDDCKSDLAAWVQHLKRDPDRILVKLGEPIPHHIWRSEELLKLYDAQGNTKVTAGGVGRELKRAGVMRAGSGGSIRTAAGVTRLWVLREPDKYLYMRDCDIAAQFNTERGLTDEVAPVATAKPIGFKGKRKKFV